jgi:2-(1,2-epoxy-1,2-dihydrophenyl)acetyl-CoA isomerase
MTTTQEELLTEQHGAAVTLWLNRPDRLNAFSEGLALCLVEALARAGADSSVRVVIVRGRGRAFSAGGDVKQMAADAAEGRPAAYFDRPLAAIHQAALAVRNLEKPVIAGLHGAVAGAGLNLALCCDYRVAADDVRLIQAFTNIGLLPDTGGTYLLPRLVGRARATELLFEGRTVDAREARELGLVNEVAPLAELDAAVERTAQRLAARPTRALGLTKRLLNVGATQTFEAQLAAEQRLQQALGADSADAIEGVRAVVGRREPRFEGR